MGRIIGTGLGLAAAAAVGATGLAKGLPPGTLLVRILAAGTLGFLAGELLFGTVGRLLIREAAGSGPPGGEEGSGKPKEGARPPGDASRPS